MALSVRSSVCLGVRLGVRKVQYDQKWHSTRGVWVSATAGRRQLARLLTRTFDKAFYKVLFKVLFKVIDKAFHKNRAFYKDF